MLLVEAVLCFHVSTEVLLNEAENTKRKHASDANVFANTRRGLD